EAMAMKKPVVALSNGGTPELVVNNETGFLAEPKSVPSLAEAISKLLRDPELRQRFAEAGRRRVEKQLKPLRMCQDMVRVYEATLARGDASLEVAARLHQV